ncbi:MAG: hypothetical protein IKU17_07610 [Clostridia bacterium]|nr:hypothetical protein [Clostridia bacterium]
MKTSKEKVRDIFNHKNTNLGAMWTGHPNDKTVPIYAKEWGIEESREAIYNFLNDDCRWIRPERGCKGVGIQPYYGMDQNHNLGGAGCLASAETVRDVETMYPWDKTYEFDFTDVYAEIDRFQDKAIFTGMWCPFFHQMADFFGMENYFCMMYEAPEVIEAATEKIVDYYVAMNDAFFAGLGDRADIMFFGNDFGTQLDLFISPEMFRRFVLPSFKRLIAVGKKYNKKIMLHSCGSIYRIIPDLIEAGVDALHPIQAAATGMSAKDLAQYKNDLVFVGGIDAQTFFVNATPQQITDEVKRVREILGPNYIVSPSHEEILPNVPAANVLAMAKAAKENY